MSTASHRPKASWFAAQEGVRPAHIAGHQRGFERPPPSPRERQCDAVRGSVRVELFVRGELMVESAERHAEVRGRSTELVQVVELFDGFRDLTDAVQLRPSGLRRGVVLFRRRAGCTLDAESCTCPPGSRGLSSRTSVSTRRSKGETGGWVLTVSTRRFAQWVVGRGAGFPPGRFVVPSGARSSSKTIALHPEVGANVSPAVEVRALNSVKSARFSG